tara:strand:- start:112 stop:471 length:360 start_codon:yes stop_codon:yes gene_type:complete
MKIKLILSLLALFAAGCSTIQFNNTGANSDKSLELEKNGLNNDPLTSSWHHNMVLSLIEVTDPVDLAAECEASKGSQAEWATVKTEHTFINGLASLVVNAFLPINLWTPMTVEVDCSTK